MVCFESTDRVGGHWHTEYDDVCDRNAVESVLAAHLPDASGSISRGRQRCWHLPAIDVGDSDDPAVPPRLRRQCPRRDQRHGRRCPAHAGGLGHRQLCVGRRFAVSRGQLVYGASKAAVIMIAKATALELRTLPDPGERDRSRIAV